MDTDNTVKPLYGKQEGAVVSYNPKKPGRPSHSYHSYFMANTRMALGVEVESGDKHTGKHVAVALWKYLNCGTGGNARTDKAFQRAYPCCGAVGGGRESQANSAEDIQEAVGVVATSSYTQIATGNRLMDNQLPFLG